MLLLPATITSREARDVQRMLGQALKSEPDSGVVIDASNLSQFDSAALAVLLECHRLAKAWGRPFSVRHASPKLAALAKLYGVDVLLMGSDVAQSQAAPPLTAPTALAPSVSGGPAS
jgi:phospholipid transport system transporter-binding protein